MFDFLEFSEILFFACKKTVSQDQLQFVLKNKQLIVFDLLYKAYKIGLIISVSKTSNIFPGQGLSSVQNKIREILVNLSFYPK
jgi:hypothetical protein